MNHSKSHVNSSIRQLLNSSVLQYSGHVKRPTRFGGVQVGHVSVSDVQRSRLVVGDTNDLAMFVNPAFQGRPGGGGDPSSKRR